MSRTHCIYPDAMFIKNIAHPTWLYHPRHGGKIFNPPEKTKWLWLFGWRDHPYPPKEERLIGKIKSIWQEWQWAVIALSAIFGLILIILNLFSKFLELQGIKGSNK